MALPTGSVIPGAVAKVRANGVVIGYATGVNANVALSAVQVKVLGSMITQQIVHTGVDVSFSVDTFRLVNDSAMVQDLFPRGNTEAIAAFPYLDFEVIDATNGGSTLTRYMKAKPTSMALNMTRDGLMGQNLSFTACTYGDETPEQVEAAVQ
jgi:hypothetical protein